MKHARCRLLRHLFLSNAILAACLGAGTVAARDGLAQPIDSAAKEQRRQELLRQLDEIRTELQALDEGQGSRTENPSSKIAPVDEEQSQDIVTLDTLEVIGYRSAAEAPKGRSVSTVEREDIEHTRGFAIKELFEETPGIFAKQGNGPRDVGISIRGSGAKQNFGVRNVKLYEDGFPVTQSDGLSRTDITDPHAYEGVDIIRGPSSSRYGNYALGGAVNFRLRKGHDLDGVEIGNDFGSFGYHNHYLHAGGQRGGFDYSVFGSYIEGDGFLDHSDFDTATENILVSYAPDAESQFTLKLVNNDLDANVPSRLSLNQIALNRRDAGTTFVSGINRTVDAERAAQSRKDRRTIVGARYEQQLGEDTAVSVMGVYDVKDINQTFFQIIDNINPNFQTALDLTHESSLFGLPARHHAGFFFDYMEQESTNFFNLADGLGTRGAVASNTRGHHRNIGGRLREELQFSPSWTAVLGVGVENSVVDATLLQNNGTSRVEVDRSFMNVAPEAALIWTASPEIEAHLRVGTGYGIPGIGNLTTASTGLPGNNTDLDTQRNVGVELGMDARHLFDILDFSLAGYYEWFFDEFVAQSPGAGLSSFTSNAPEAEHRGVELVMALHPFRGGDPLWEGLYLKTAYTFNDHIYTDFTEVINGVPFDRSGNEIPGVERHLLNAKLGYESPFRVGGWLEFNYVGDFHVNNSNTLEFPNYHLLNLNLHYGENWEGKWVSGVEVFFEVQNLLDKDYIESANVVTDDVVNTPASLANKAAFFAGPERSFFGGVRLKF